MRKCRPELQCFFLSCLKRKKDTESMPAAPILPQNHSTGLSTPFQLIFKSNSSPQYTLQALELWCIDGSTDHKLRDRFHIAIALICQRYKFRDYILCIEWV